MITFFRDKSVTAIFLLIILCFFIHIHLFLVQSHVVISDDDGILSMLFQKYIVQLSPLVISISYVFIVLIQATRLNMVLNEAKMFQTSGFTTAMSYVLLSAFIPQWCSLTPALISNSFIIWIFIKLIRLNSHSSPRSLLFNTGLITGITILCYHPTAILLLVVLFALAVVRPFKLSEWFILLIGAAIPVYFLISGLFLFNQMHFLQNFLPELKLNLPVQKADVWLWISLGCITALLLLGFFYWAPYNRRMVIQIRKNWGIVIVMLLIMLPIPFIFKNAGLESSILSLVPLSCFISNFFLYPKRTLLNNLFFLIAIALIIHTNLQLLKF